MSLFLILAGVVLFFAKEVLQIDLKKEEHRTAFSLFGLFLGKWEDLPEVEYVSIFPTKLSQTINSAQTGTNSSMSHEEVRVNFIYQKNKRMHVFTSNNIEEVRQVALRFAEIMNLGVYDCSGEENVWLKGDKNTKFKSE
ncbi:MAG: hypothetical protein ACPGTP_05520 [Bacteroidia bacterium]